MKSSAELTATESNGCEAILGVLGGQQAARPSMRATKIYIESRSRTKRTKAAAKMDVETREIASNSPSPIGSPLKRT